MNKTANLCRAKISKNGKYLILPIRTSNGTYENVILEINSKKFPSATLASNPKTGEVRYCGVCVELQKGVKADKKKGGK